MLSAMVLEERAMLYVGVVIILVALYEWYARYSVSGPVVWKKKTTTTSTEFRDFAVSAEDVDALVKVLDKRVRSGETKSYDARVAALKGLLRFFDDEKDAILTALKKDLGRPDLETLAYDIYSPRTEILHLLNNLPRLTSWKRAGFDWSLTTFPYNGAYIAQDPYGVVCVMGTWNFPFMLSLVPVAGALAAGNAVVLKPCCSGKSQESSKLMATLLPKYLPKSAFHMVVPSSYTPQTDLTASKAVLKAPFDMYFFTGSTRVGSIVAEAAKGRPCVLECGGKSPTYVHDDCDVKLAAKRILWGRTLNAGQQCVAPDYVLCAKSKIDEFCTALKGRIVASFGENPKNSPDFARIVDLAECERLKRLLSSVSPETIIAGGEIDFDSKYVAPTIVLLEKDKDKDVALLKEEIFGPILPIVPVDSLDDAVDYINARPKPLACYVFASKGHAVAKDILTWTSAGGCCVNDTIFHAGHPCLPFGGVGASGYGAYHGDATYTAFTHTKSILIKSTGLLSEANFFVYPPLSSLKTTLLTGLMAPTHLLRFSSSKKTTTTK